MSTQTWKVALAGLIATVAALPAWAAAPEDGRIGTVKVVKGGVNILRGSQTLVAAPGAGLQVADRVVTAADGATGITLRDNTLLSAGPNSSLSLDNFAEARHAVGGVGQDCQAVARVGAIQHPEHDAGGAWHRVRHRSRGSGGLTWVP